MEPLRTSAWRRRALYATLAFFFYIQLEWMWIVRRAADEGHLAALSGPDNHISWCVPKCSHDDFDERAWEPRAVVAPTILYSYQEANKNWS
jgi:hypothetical protein